MSLLIVVEKFYFLGIPETLSQIEAWNLFSESVKFEFFWLDLKYSRFYEKFSKLEISLIIHWI